MAGFRAFVCELLNLLSLRTMECVHTVLILYLGLSVSSMTEEKKGKFEERVDFLKRLQKT